MSAYRGIADLIPGHGEGQLMTHCGHWALDDYRHDGAPSSSIQLARADTHPITHKLDETVQTRSRFLSESRRDCRRLFGLPKEVEHWSLTTLREKLVKIGAKVVSHGR